MRLKEEEFKKGNLAIWKEDIKKKTKKSHHRYNNYDDDDDDEDYDENDSEEEDMPENIVDGKEKEYGQYG